MKFVAPALTPERLYIQDQRRRNWDTRMRQIESIRYESPNNTIKARRPKSLALRILRDLEFDANMRNRLFLSREDVIMVSRWASAMPEWSPGAVFEGPPDV